jgi:chorismate mutase
MGRLLVALHPDAGVNAEEFVVAWNTYKGAVGAEPARAEQAGPEQFIPGMAVVAVPLQDQQASDVIYAALKDVLERLQHNLAKPTEALLSTTLTGEGDLFAMIPAPPAVPPAAPKMVAITWVLTHVCSLSRMLSLAARCHCDSRQGRMHIYVLVWLALLCIGLAACPIILIHLWSRILVLVLVFYRLQELMFATFDNALKLSERSRKDLDVFKWPTPLLLALFSIIQTVLIFAIAYLILAGHHPAAFARPPPSSPFNAFYLSWISLPPLGGGATPLSTMARGLTIGEEATALLLVVIAIGRFLAGPD